MGIKELEFQKFKAEAEMLEADIKHGKLEKFVFLFTGGAFVTHIIGIFLSSSPIILSGLVLLLVGNLTIAPSVFKILDIKEDAQKTINKCDELIEKLKKEQAIETLSPLNKDQLSQTSNTQSIHSNTPINTNNYKKR